MRLITLGTGNAFAEGGRFHSAVAIRTGHKTLLVDCGPCIMPALRRAKIMPEEIDAVLVTHLHGDHIGGVPMLLLEYQFGSRRKRPLLVVGPKRCVARLEALTALMFREVARKRRNFPVVYQEIAPRDEVRLPGGTRIRAYPMKHVDWESCLGYRIESRGKSIAITGDTTWCPSIPEMSQGADLLLTECTHFDSASPVHLSYTGLLKHESEISAKRLVLTHVGAGLLKNRAKVRHRHHIARDGEWFEV
jgi:ribonuclease BN (tRNA processing enzyme)